MWSIIPNALRYAFPILVGYFSNDIVEIASNVTDKKDPSTGKPPFWLVAVVMVMLGLIVYLVLSLINSISKK